MAICTVNHTAAAVGMKIGMLQIYTHMSELYVCTHTTHI